jgi:hypothetical protein
MRVFADQQRELSACLPTRCYANKSRRSFAPVPDRAALAHGWSTLRIGPQFDWAAFVQRQLGGAAPATSGVLA